MKTFTSFWLLCSLVKGNFILMCVDGKSMKVIAAYQNLHEVQDATSVAPQLIKSTAVRWLLALCAGEHRGLQMVTTLTAASPHHLPSALQEVTFHQKSENVNQDAFTLFMMRYLWWQESRPAGLLGPFQTCVPAGDETHLQTSFPLPMLTHTPKQLIYKTTHQ